MSWRKDRCAREQASAQLGDRAPLPAADRTALRDEVREPALIGQSAREVADEDHEVDVATHPRGAAGM
jgi:hypothetical protein